VLDCSDASNCFNRLAGGDHRYERASARLNSEFSAYSRSSCRLWKARLRWLSIARPCVAYSLLGILANSLKPYAARRIPGGFRLDGKFLPMLGLTRDEAVAKGFGAQCSMPPSTRRRDLSCVAEHGLLQLRIHRKHRILKLC